MTAASTILRARLAALIELNGHSLTGLARAMDRSHTWLLRKLDTDTAEPRPLTVEDMDAVLGFLGAPPAALLAPVLLPGDRELLGYVGSSGSVTYGGGVTAVDVAAVFAQGPAALARMAAQGLVEAAQADDATRYQITPLGASAL